jgi:hypothetical protein
MSGEAPVPLAPEGGGLNYGLCSIDMPPGLQQEAVQKAGLAT